MSNQIYSSTNKVKHENHQPKIQEQQLNFGKVIKHYPLGYPLPVSSSINTIKRLTQPKNTTILDKNSNPIFIPNLSRRLKFSPLQVSCKNLNSSIYNTYLSNKFRYLMSTARSFNSNTNSNPRYSYLGYVHRWQRDFNSL